MTANENKPPRFFLNLFRWFCHPDFQEEIEGDLLERFNNDSEKFGRRNAKWIFIKEVMLLFRPALIGNITQLTNLKSINMLQKNKRLRFIMATAIGILFIPLIAMQFSEEVDWGVLDFVIMGLMLFIVGLLFELVLRKVKSMTNRIVLFGAILAVFFLIWAELAVGIFGTIFAGN